jgi:hypothetical protein
LARALAGLPLRCATGEVMVARIDAAIEVTR